jgi:hypothetical protein
VPQAPGKPVVSTPYDFIMNSSTPAVKIQKKHLPKVGAIVGIAAGLVIIVFAILSFANRSTATPILLSIAQQQTEISRVAQLNLSKLDDSSVKNFSINTSLTLTSSQAEYLKFLAAHKSALDEKLLTAGMNKKTDTALEAAASNGTLNSATRTVLIDELTTYQRSLTTAYNETQSKTARAEYKALFEEAALLIEQGKE